MKGKYSTPLLRAYKVEASPICASAKGLQFSENGESGAWAESQTWSGVMLEEEENSGVSEEQ